MPRLIVTPAALDGLDRCRIFLEKIDDTLAERAAVAIASQLRRLATTPQTGRRVGASGKLQELVIPFGRSGYIGLYRHDAEDDVVYLLAFRHQREAGY